jgi:hypothetical protein
MSAFDIAPHSRRGTRLAMGVLALVAMAAFAEGFLRQVSSDMSAPPPRARPADAIAEATPAPIPALQIPTAPKPRRALADNSDAPPVLDVPAAPGSPAAGVAAPVAADAAATAPAAPVSAPQPAAAPDEAPT